MSIGPFPALDSVSDYFSSQATGLFEVFGENNWYPNGQPKADLDERGQLRCEWIQFSLVQLSRS